LTTAEALAVLPDCVNALHVGSLGLMLEPVASALEAVVEAVPPTTLVAIDPNCRPWAIADPDAYRDRLARIFARCDVIKVSEEDLAWLEPDRPPLAVARALLDHGSRVVLLTRGAGGGAVVMASGVTSFPAPRVRVHDTIGAGDAFGGAFLAWYMRSGIGAADLFRPEVALAAAEFASLVASRTCERPGASPPLLADLLA
jgi:fructokinase